MTKLESTLHRIKAFSDMWDERERQVKKWGSQRHPDGTSADYGYARDVARLNCDIAAGKGECTWLHILEEEVLEAFSETDPVRLKEELVQAGAVIVSWLEDLEGRGV
jgi:hypothetical protein